MSALWAMVAGLLILTSLPAEGGEARRCLRDGKVIITDVSCELLGNAIDLAPPLPEKHFKRGEPERRPVTAPAPVEKILPPLPMDPIKPPASSPLRQLLSQLLDTLLIPFLFIAFLSAWLAQQTKKSVQRHRWDRQPKTEGTRPAAKRIEPSDGSTGREAGISRREPAASPGTITTNPALATASDPSAADSARDSGAGGDWCTAEPKASEWTLELIRDLEWKRFEDVCQQFYAKKGIRSETTPLGPDGGIDLRLYQDHSGLPTAIVQCKAWGKSMVGVKPVRELLGVMTHEKIANGYFMTSGSYSEDAKAVAQANRITLIDGTMLLSMLQGLPVNEREIVLRFATEGDYRTPTCPSCGNKMEPKSGKSGRPDFWGCPRTPRCRGKLGMRQR